MSAPVTEPMFDAHAFGLRVIARRAELQLTIREAAAAVGISPAAIVRAERCEPNLSHENVLRLGAWLEGPQ